jgi:hypothetical protein
VTAAAGLLTVELLARGAQAPPFQSEAQSERRFCAAQHALEAGDEQRELVEIDASLLEGEAAGCARGCPAAARIRPSHQEHRQRQRVIEHQPLDVRGSAHRDQRVTDREGAPEAALRRSGIAHERMFARKDAFELS